MGRVKHSVEQIINKMREVELDVGRGTTLQEAVRKIGISEQTFYKRRRTYGTMHINQAKRLKELEKENSKLRRVVADLAVDNAVLKDVALGKS
jgi:ACT domain-containing protein